MNKDIEWLREKLNSKAYTDTFGRNVILIGQKLWNELLDEVKIAKQLDEPETLSQDWIDDNTWNNHYVGKPFVYVEDLKNLLVPKQEKPLVDKKDAKNIVEYKSKEWTLTDLLYDTGIDAEHDELLARAWFAYPNIEVEEE